MTALSHLLLGAALVVAGVILVVVFGDEEFIGFRGQPLGIVLAICGVLDLGEGVRRKLA